MLGAFGCAVCAVLWWAPSYAYVVEGAVPRAAGAKGDAVRPLLGVYSLFIVPVFQGAGGVFMPLGDDIFAFCTGGFRRHLILRVETPGRGPHPTV